MKIILILTIVVCFVLLGYGLANYYIERKKFFSEFELFMSNLSSNINFGREKIIDIINKYSSQHKCYTMNKLCENYIRVLKQHNSSKDYLFEGISILKKEEVDLLQNFFSTLGKFDIYTQTKEINSYAERISELYKSSYDDYKKYGSLMIKLALVVGLLVCLLII